MAATPPSGPAAGARARLQALARFARIVADHPAEAVERVRNRLEVAREQRRSPGPHPYQPHPDWEARLHQRLGAAWPCPVRHEFDAVYRQVQDGLGSPGPGSGPAHDPDVAVARAAWCLVRHRRPATVVETGVARGVTSRLILEAMEANAAGRLWSVDLPPTREPWAGQVAAAVPDSLRHRWTYLRGSSRRLLPGLLADLERIDMFVHDSLHTEGNIAFELSSAWPALGAGGVLLADDIGWNPAFEAFGRAATGAETLVAAQEAKVGGLFGLAVKV